MKTVGIITIFRVNNYGAELQAFATQRFIQLMGYDSEIINYPYFVNPNHKATRKSRAVFPISLKLRVIKIFLPLIDFGRGLKQDRIVRLNRINNFESFHTQYSKLSDEYRTIESLYKNHKDYDVYIVGSDQVWNPENNTSLDPYFLKFAPKGKIRLSYASSFGTTFFPEYTKKYYRNALMDLDAIGVREENAVQTVKDISGKKAQWVLDPTLMLDAQEWSSVAKKVNGLPEKFILLYEITACPYLKVLAEQIAKETQTKIVRINRDASLVEKDGSIINVPEAGPSEFIWLFEHAVFVVTNSFHGTAFSINFNKDFYVVTPARKNNNSRLQSILSLFSLNERLIKENEPLPDSDKWQVDFSHVNAILSEEVKKSQEFVKKAIDGE